MPVMPTMRLKLGDHVQPRSHETDEGVWVVLHDDRSGGVVRLGEAEWRVVAAADGTRDVEGIVRRARADGSALSPASCAELLSALQDAGLLEDTADREGIARAVDAPAPVLERPLSALPGFVLRCDGRGSCCRFFGTVVLRREEARLAEALARTDAYAMRAGALSSPDERTPGGQGAHIPRCLPLYGTEDAAMSTSFVQGRCALLQTDGLCSIHRRAGADAKPLGCQLFPWRFVDDGERVRVVPTPSCACVLASGHTAATDAELESELRGLPAPAQITALEGPFTLPGGPVVDVAGLRSWIDEQLTRLEGHDVVLALIGAASLETDPASIASVLAPRLSAMDRRASSLAHRDAAWRGDHDLARKTSSIVAAATALLRDPEVLLAALSPRNSLDETTYARCQLFGYAVALRGPLASSLLELSLRVVVARAAALLVDPADDPAFEHPLALVEALAEGYGVTGAMDA